MNWTKEIILDELIKNGDVSLERGRVISSIDLMKYPGNYPVYSSSAKKNGRFGSFDLYDFDEELITWSVDGGGYFFYRPKHKFSVTNVSGILRILSVKKLDYKFLYYSLVYQHKNQIFDYVDKAHPSVIRKRYFIPDIDYLEQQKIAQILSKVDKAISQTEQLIAKYSKIKIGLMQDLLTKGIDENGNIRSEETHEFKDSPLGRIPVEWECISIGEMADLKSGGTPSRQNLTFWNGNIFWVKTGEVDYNLIEKTEESITEEGLQFSSASLFPKGTILMALYGQGKTRGRVAILGVACTTNQACLGFLNLRKVTTNFLYHSLVFEYENLRDLSNDGAQKNLSGSLLKKYFLKIPSSKQEQVAIDEMFKKIDFSIQNKNNNLAKLQSIKTGLMQDLLSGKVRVNHLITEKESV